MDRLYKRPEFVDYDEAFKTFTDERKKMNEIISSEDYDEFEKQLKFFKLRAGQGNPIYMDLLAYYYKTGVNDLLGGNYDRYMSWEILAAARGNEFAIEKLQFLFNTAFDTILSDEKYDEICYKNDIDDTNELYKLGKNICKMLVRELSLFPVDLAGAKDETVKYTQEKFIYYRKKIDEIVEPTIKFLLS